MIIKTLGAFAVVFAFGIIIDIPKRLLMYAAAIGALSWFVYLSAERFTSNIIIVVFMSTFVVAVLSNVFARIFKTPVSLFLVSGILPSVPGGSVYRMVYYILSNDTVKANYYFVEALQISGAIAMAIFLTESVVRAKKKYTQRDLNPQSSESESDALSD